MDNNLYLEAVEEKIDSDGIRTRILNEIPMFNSLKKIKDTCKEETKDDFKDIRDEISAIKGNIETLKGALNQQSEQIKSLNEGFAKLLGKVEELTSSISPIVEDFRSQKLRPRTLYEKAVGKFIDINEKFENAAARILRETLKNGNQLILPFTSLLNYFIDPNYEIDQTCLYVINQDKQSLKEIYENIKMFHVENLPQIEKFLETKSLSFRNCVKLFEGNEFLSEMMEYREGGKPSSSGKVFVLSLYYNFPETNAREHKAKVYPNDVM